MIQTIPTELTQGLMLSNQPAYRMPRIKQLNDRAMFDLIMKVVEEKTGYNQKKLASKDRRTPVTTARYIAFALCRKYTKMGLKIIGDEFGRDHTTVLHGLQQVREIWPINHMMQPYYRVEDSLEDRLIEP